ncbi:MAG: sulfur carrier protein ThiS [Sterolibacterium sp.]
MNAQPQFTLNGQARRLEAETCVAQLLEDLGYAGKRVAVEMDGEIVPKSRHAETLIKAGNRIEIVVAVGGG